MKKQLLFTVLAGSFATLIFSSHAVGPYNGGAGNHTGSLGSPANCSTGSGCHATNNTNTTASLLLVSPTNDTVKDGQYLPNTNYKVVVVGANPTANLVKFGFQASCVDNATSTTQKGTFTSSNSQVSVINGGAIKLVEQNTPISAVTTPAGNAYGTTFNWTSPATGGGAVKFYLTLNAVNGNTTSSGDQPNAATPLTFTEKPTSVSNIKLESSDLYPNPTRAELILKIKDWTAGNYQVIIYGLDGKVMLQQTASLSAGAVQINVAQLAPGAYFISLNDGGKKLVGSFIKN
ncbi:MAG: T9SS type A sorting domain-containing protein [Bacteroidetes bacterium]|nr:T9SS type A sorting domain-containing protein [Bacteroidota bacterium]